MQRSFFTPSAGASVIATKRILVLFRERSMSSPTEDHLSDSGGVLDFFTGESNTFGLDILFPYGFGAGRQRVGRLAWFLRQRLEHVRIDDLVAVVILVSNPVD